MKNFVLLYSVSLLTVLHVSRGGTIEGVRKLAGIIKGSCIANTGVRTELIDDAIEGNFAEDPKLKCFAKCILAMLQSIRGNKFSSEGLKLIVKAILPDDLKERGYAAIEKCKDTWDESEDLCSASFSVVKCFYRTDIEFCLLLL